MVRIALAKIANLVLTLTLASLLCAPACLAQTVPLVKLHDFNPSPNGSNPVGSLVLASDGNFYGTANAGGTFGYGVVFKMTPTGTITLLHSFNDTDGASPKTALVQGTDGNFYGTTNSGGASHYGVVFKLTSDGTYTDLHDFSKTEGGYATALVQGADGAFYGSTAFEVYKISSTGTFQVVSTEASSSAALLLASDGNFYGTTNGGGTHKLGSVFQCTPAGTVTTLYSFTGGDDGGYLYAKLVEGADGQLYSTTGFYGTGNHGTVFKITKTGTLTTLHRFIGTDGGNPYAGLTLAADGNFYGTTGSYGANHLGVVYKMTPAGDVTAIYSFTSDDDGYFPSCDLVQASDGSLYGTEAGNHGFGSVFKITTAGALTVLNSFPGAEGATPDTALAQDADGNLYGVTYNGGTYNLGTVFRYSSTGVFTTLHSFAGGAECGNPEGGLVLAPDGNFYGTTGDVGGQGVLWGTIYRITPAGDFTIIHTFNKTDGWRPDSTMVIGPDGALYGTTNLGGANSQGSIFKITTAGVFTSVYNFTGGDDGGEPLAALTLGTDGNFYGTCAYKGHFGYGTIFTMTPAGVLTTLHAFTGYYNGIDPNSKLVQASDGNFYGTTESDLSGSFGNGVVYEITPTGTFSIIHSFDTGDSLGTYPYTGLLRAPDGYLYGTTEAGGPSGGTIFRFSPSNPTLTTVQTFNGVNGGAPQGDLSLGTDGNIYGTTANGGTVNRGVIFQLQTAFTHATFVKTDTATQGNWKGVYGSDGWNVIGDSHTQTPGYATLTPGTHTSGVWANPSLSPACLQAPTAGSANRLAGVWFNTSWTTNVNVGGPHQLALYLLDQPNAGYAETITLKNATTGAVLDTRTAANFSGGVYYVWNVSGSVNITLTSTAGHWAVLSGIFLGPETGSTAPTTPAGLQAVPGTAQATLTWTASTGATSYNVYRGTAAGGESTTPIATGITSATYTNSGLTNGTAYYYKVVAVNTVGGSFASAEVSAIPLAPTASATFVKTDTTTHGNWKGAYGGDGWNVIGDTHTQTPAYATLTPGAHTAGVWATASLAPACLQAVTAGSANRLAGVWFNTSWTTNVKVSGSHQLALYLLDQPNAGYAETITLKNATTGAVLDTRTASNFSGGVYYVWTVSGNVNITLTSTAGHWAVLSAIFFGPATGSTAPSTPAGLVATPGAARAILTWTASTGATSYNVYRGTTAGGESTTPIATGITGATFTNTGLTAGTTYYYKVVAVNAVGGSFASTEVSATPPTLTSSATFVKTDTTTQGNWKGVYGADGYNIIGDDGSTVYPAYATVTKGTQVYGEWTKSSTEVRCLQKHAANSTDRVAGIWYTTSWSTGFNLTGTHQLAFYFLDYPNSGFAETVTIKDTATGVVLDTRSVSNFYNGIYEVWNISGNVTFTFTSTAGHWAPISGFFFG